jgi:hypothetical protein
MDEVCGPYCNACSADFLAFAEKLLGPAPERGYAREFRARMHEAHAYPQGSVNSARL